MAKTKSVSAKVGETFEVSLESNPTTGYEWTPHFVKTAVQLAKAELRALSPNVGGGAQQVFVFQALAKGETTIRLVHKRQWESEPLEERSITVTVR